MNYENPETPATTATELVERYIGIAYDKKMSMEEVLTGTSWNLDLNAGIITFGPERVFPMQVLGSFDKSTEIWTWGWANEKTKIPEPLLLQARQLREYGEEHQIQMFTLPQFNSSISDLYFLGSIAVGLFESSASYMADYGGGMLLVTMESAEIDQFPKADLERIPRVFTQITAGYAMEHRAALLHYLARKGYTAIETGHIISAEVDGGSIVATFSDEGRITNMRAVGK